MTTVLVTVDAGAGLAEKIIQIRVEAGIEPGGRPGRVLPSQEQKTARVPAGIPIAKKN